MYIIILILSAFTTFLPQPLTHIINKLGDNYTFCFLDISSESILDESKICIAVSSSRMFPSEADRVCRILSSISFSCFLLAAL